MRSIKARERQPKTTAPRESKFQNKLIKRLKKIPNSYFFVKEAGAIRGISDIIGVINGRSIFLEAKKAESELTKYHPRNALQKKFLADTRKAGAYSSYVYPENEEQVISDLIALSIQSSQ